MKLPGNRLAQRIIVAIAATILIVWFYPHQNNNTFIYEEGRPWNYAQLIAPFDIPIHPDSLTVDRIRDTLNKTFVPIYTLAPKVVDSIVDELPASIGSTNRQSLAKVIKQIYEDGVVDNAVMDRINDRSLTHIRVLEANTLYTRSTAGLTSPRDIYEHLDNIVKDRYLRSYFLSTDLHSILRPNLIHNQVENQRVFDNEFQALTADRGVILQGQTIINKGDIVTAQDYTNLRTYENLMRDRTFNSSESEILIILGQVLYVAILLSLLIAYFGLFARPMYDDFKTMLFIFVIVTVAFLLSVTMSLITHGGIYIVPMAIIPVLILAFFDGRTALFVSTISILLCAPVAPFALEYIFLEFSTAAVAIYTLGELRSRLQLMRMAVAVASTYFIGYISLELLLNGAFAGLEIRTFVFFSVNALLTSLAHILMFAAERTFGFVSVATLYELADINQPLLRKLSDTCPGTFQHCMSVSNLAADAARAMGANEQLVRVGAMYHDIGKMSNPAFFTENQHGVNPHDALPPEQSARIVVGHVTEGLQIATKEGLPDIVKDFICQHHGRGKAKYFYFTYCKAHPDETTPNEAPFTYPGPNPTSRETSLLMMADAVEAASRSLTDYSRQSINDLVNKIVDGQISEGLHADSSLEFRDVAIIKSAFAKRLGTIYHSRVAYPKAATETSATTETPETPKG